MKEKVWKWIKVKVLEFRKVWEDDMKGMCDGDQCVGVRALWDGCYAVQVGSMRGYTLVIGASVGQGSWSFPSS